jgi:REP element-mobilizing transposase RayT
MGEASERYGVRIHGFCLIPNHFHMLMQQQELPVSQAMRSLETNYARYFNKKYHKTGHVFQGRYRGILCDQASHLLELLRYIHLNPVRAGLVEMAHAWPWSSLSAYLGLRPLAWLFQKDVLELFGGRPRQRLLEFLSQAPDLTPDQIYPAEALSIMGSEEFVKQVTNHGEPRRWRQRVYIGPKLPLQRIAEILCGAAGITVGELCFHNKGSQTQSQVREQLVHIATRIMFYPGAAVARFLQVTAPAITLANQRYDRRIRQHPQRERDLINLLMGNT